MNGNIEITYKVVNSNDLKLSITLEELLKNEKIVKTIKSEFAKGFRNIDIKIDSELNDKFNLETIKDYHTLIVSKNDFADILTLVEEDASKKKLLKKDCFVELVDIKTVE